MIEDNPRLKRYPAEKLEESYQRARRQATKQTHLTISVFPEICPDVIGNVLVENWLPENQ